MILIYINIFYILEKNLKIPSMLAQKSQCQKFLGFTQTD